MRFLGPIEGRPRARCSTLRYWSARVGVPRGIGIPDHPSTVPNRPLLSSVCDSGPVLTPPHVINLRLALGQKSGRNQWRAYDIDLRPAFPTPPSPPCWPDELRAQSKRLRPSSLRWLTACWWTAAARAQLTGLSSTPELDQRVKGTARPSAWLSCFSGSWFRSASSSFVTTILFRCAGAEKQGRPGDPGRRRSNHTPQSKRHAARFLSGEVRRTSMLSLCPHCGHSYARFSYPRWTGSMRISHCGMPHR